MKQRLLKGALAVVVLLAAFTLGRIIGNNLFPVAKAIQLDSRYGSIVRLVSNEHTFCTGTVVQDNLIITAAHCVLMETPFGLMLAGNAIEVRPSDNTEIGTTANVVYASPQMDQAMLTGDFKAYKQRKYITDPEKLTNFRRKDTKFISCGFPLNGDMYCNETTFDKPADFFWDVNGVLIPGMSGGPTFLPDGTMVGVNVAVHGDKSVVSPIYNITRNLAGMRK